MRYRVLGIVVAACIVVSVGLPSLAQSPLFSYGPPGPGSSPQCAPRQQVPQPVARSVQVQVPLSCGPGALSPSPCGEVRYRPSPAMPVRVEVAVKPEPLCDPRRIPVRFRDPGPFQPIIYSGVGLVGATIAAPFRLLETLFPCGRQQPCPGPFLRAGCAPPGPSVPPGGFGVPCFPGNVRKVCMPQPPACGMPPGACPPPGPSIAPLPSAPCPSPYACAVPPRMVQDNPLPYWEPQSLLGGLWNLPGTLLSSGRLTGDLGKPTPPCTR
jgi:hypothetical protein